jgi:hypothetical protein
VPDQREKNVLSYSMQSTEFPVYLGFSLIGFCFYFPHMKYGKVLVSPPENQKFFAFFHVLGLIIPKKHV